MAVSPERRRDRFRTRKENLSLVAIYSSIRLLQERFRKKKQFFLKIRSSGQYQAMRINDSKSEFVYAQKRKKRFKEKYTAKKIFKKETRKRKKKGKMAAQ